MCQTAFISVQESNWASANNSFSTWRTTALSKTAGNGTLVNNLMLLVAYSTEVFKVTLASIVVSPIHASQGSVRLQVCWASSRLTGSVNVCATSWVKLWRLRNRACDVLHFAEDAIYECILVRVGTKLCLYAYWASRNPGLEKRCLEREERKGERIREWACANVLVRKA